MVPGVKPRREPPPLYSEGQEDKFCKRERRTKILREKKMLAPENLGPVVDLGEKRRNKDIK